MPASCSARRAANTARSLVRSFGRGAAARADAGALDDPVVVDADALGDLAVRDDLGRQVVAEAEDRRGARRRRAAASRAASRAIWCSSGGSAALGMDESFSGSLERDALEDALAHPGEHLAGADLDEGGARRPRAGRSRSRASAPAAISAPASSSRTSVERRGARAGEDGEARARGTRPRPARRGTAPTAGSIAGEWNAPATSRRIARGLALGGDLLGAVERVDASRRGRPGRARCRWRR